MYYIHPSYNKLRRYKPSYREIRIEIPVYTSPVLYLLLPWFVSCFIVISLDRLPE